MQSKSKCKLRFMNIQRTLASAELGAGTNGLMESFAGEIGNTEYVWSPKTSKLSLAGVGKADDTTEDKSSRNASSKLRLGGGGLCSTAA